MKKILTTVLATSLLLSITPRIEASEQPHIDEEEPNNTFETAIVANHSTNYVGKIDNLSEDIDMYKFSIPNDRNLDIGISVNNEEHNRIDPETKKIKFELFDENGTLIAKGVPDEREPIDLSIETLLKKGDYFIKVSSDLTSSDESINYIFDYYSYIPHSRISGEDRYETSVEISKEWPKEETKYAVLTTGEEYPDALAATPLAKKYNAPLLLSKEGEIPDVVVKELKRLGVKKVDIIGGEKALSSNIEKQLRDLDINFNRIAGKNRYETAIKVAEEVDPDPSEIVVATGEEFADALSIAPIAASQGMPVILTESDRVVEEVGLYISQKNIDKSYIIGGEKAINRSVAGHFPNRERIFGKDRYETNKQIINTFIEGIDPSIIHVATGNNFPDALSGSAFAAQNNHAILLTSDYVPTNDTISVVYSNYDNIKQLNILGGEQAVDKYVIYHLKYPWNF
ncbi:cell wall-binding repeat-containing protein [Bacillus carboniphilus]|uniref:Cell wall-binding repeat-containing protein n=1 Tax=Bacillus carboniphilus TaxID=86663 RepID=A0ABY9JPH8_9BACI|nr:cell wall-binding repeat-containing protein [Bacillus carboniphilus]WLR41291.1 cell wall-binding repeat-containing protein [Bacillus carboniphilus]